MRRKTELTSSSLVPFHDSFHLSFSFFKQLQDKIKTLMSGFSQMLINHNKVLVCRCKPTFFSFVCLLFCLLFRWVLLLLSGFVGFFDWLFCFSAWSMPMRYADAVLQSHSLTINSRTAPTALYCLSEANEQISSLWIKPDRNHCLTLLGRFRVPGKSMWSEALLCVSKGDQSVISSSVGINLTVYRAEKTNDEGLASIQYSKLSHKTFHLTQKHF